MILPPIHSFIANAFFYSCRRTRIPERAADVDDRAPPERASLSRKQPAPHSEFDPKSSTDGQYAGAIEQKERRESIPSVLYPIAGRDPRERMRLPHAAGCGDARVGRGLGRHAAETFARRRTRGWCRATNHSAVACTAPPAQKVFTRRAFCDKTRTFPPPACLPWNFLPQPTTVRLLVRPPPAQKVFTRKALCQEHSSSPHSCLPSLEIFCKVHLRTSSRGPGPGTAPLLLCLLGDGASGPRGLRPPPHPHPPRWPPRGRAAPAAMAGPGGAGLYAESWTLAQVREGPRSGGGGPALA